MDCWGITERIGSPITLIGTDMSHLPPPWIVFPDLSPDDPATQGVAEAYLDLDWLPFWRTLSSRQQELYLDRWQASDAWRTSVAMRYGPQSFDLNEDARDSEAWAKADTSLPRNSIIERLRRSSGLNDETN